jgi:hypothetical protein
MMTMFRTACAGLFLFGLGTVESRAQPAGHGFHPAMPDQEFTLQCRLEPTSGEPLAVEAPLPLQSLLAPTELDLPVALPSPGPGVRVKRYLPRAVLEQSVVAEDGPNARPAVELSIEGPSQSYRRWLLADDAERNRLMSFIGTWRYMAVQDHQQREALLQQFKEELTRAPVLRMGAGGGGEARSLPARPGEQLTFDQAGCRVRVIQFYPHYGIDATAKSPKNLSDRRINPAALVEIERGAAREERWVFAKFPDFKTASSQIPLVITLECPLETQGNSPDFVLVTIGRSKHEIWKRHQGRTSEHVLGIDEKVEVPGSPYTFRLTRFVPAGRLTEQYVQANEQGTVSALQVEVREQGGSSQIFWLESGKQRTVPIPDGLLLMAFGPRAKAAGHP